MALNGELSTSNNNAVEQKIEEIINKRKAMRPIVQSKLNNLKSLGNNVKSLYDSLDRIINNSELDKEFREMCKSILSKNLNLSFHEGITALENIKGRFERDSINIGVTGHSQVGKSTLLQKISGLGNEQIPSGDGKPTTAARSRIFNVASKDQEGATITFYSDSEFIETVLNPYFSQLQPYFNEINKNNSNKLYRPNTVNDFLRMSLPVDLQNGYYVKANDSFKNVEANGKRTDANDEAVLKRLWEMQHDSETWKPLLNQYNKRINLNEIKKYIAYPTDEEIETAKRFGKNAERAYLAVKDVEVNCCFKNANVQHLGIFDLPGLGEIIPQESMFCIMQYSTELDLTVLITRPTSAYKSFTDHDSKALANANNVRKPVKKAEDFTVIVINNINELKKILEEEKKQCVLLGKFENFNHKGMIEAKKKSGYVKSERSVGGTKNPRTDSYSNRAIIVSSEPVISDWRSDNGGEPNSDDTGACEDSEQNGVNSLINNFKKGSINVLDTVGEKFPPFKKIGDRFTETYFFSQSRKESKPRDNHKPKVGENIDKKA